MLQAENVPLLVQQHRQQIEGTRCVIVVIRKVGPTIIVYGISFLLFILILTKIAYTVSIVTEKRTKISFGI